MLPEIKKRHYKKSTVGLSVGLFLQNELKRGIYGKSAKIKNRFFNNLSKLRRLENSGVLTTNQ